VPSAAEHGKVVFIAQAADTGQLELQKRVLPRVEIHGNHAFGPREGIVQGVAARRGDDQDRVVGPEFEGDPVQARVLPAGVVDEVVLMHELKHAAAHPFADGHDLSSRV
jgi:hypothetical protein